MSEFVDSGGRRTARRDDILFYFDHYFARSLTQSDVGTVQRFFECNPDYFELWNGIAPRSNEAQLEFDDLPPPEMPYARRWMVGCFDDNHSLLAFATVIKDLLAAHVWHTSLFVTATSLRGTGFAAKLYMALETWMRAGGALWLRLGVLRGHTRAESFWRKMGYIEVRNRHGINTGVRIVSNVVMIKPLTDASINLYLELVPRDRPESASASSPAVT